ncbi:4-alpha-glucanotransferase [Fulvimonas sp. R45]|uniref:4-alpha-glucanotransferase n=1 Tax=Fulvimonas sp. R45 TaxID=3045937 RepID=UPI00265DD487|nr:4-alpha-glucanotransferase [Fulvimonas sp. R45]MDO1528806.1 4-alpha-glucanotransferase [Fulvimonas sp. R45]
MSAPPLETLAEAAGIEVRWTGADGRMRQLAPETLHALLDAQQLPSRKPAQRADSLHALHERDDGLPALLTVDAGRPARLPSAPGAPTPAQLRDEHGRVRPLRLDADGRFRAPVRCGYYRLAFGACQLELAVAPSRCFGVADALGVREPRCWGLAAQVYALRRPGDGGLGDSRAVATLARQVGHAGGDALALSPLHAAGPDRSHYSPYAPSNRCLLDWSSADPAQVLGRAALREAIAQAGAGDAWERAEAGALIDWPAQRALRRRVWQALQHGFAHARPALRRDFAAFVARRELPLRAHALVATRQQAAAARGESAAWTQWRGDWHSAHAPAARAFAAAHAPALDFEVFAQWLAARSWACARRAARAVGLRIGLVHDLATGFDPGGSEAWIHREATLQALELGAPPDAFNPAGQGWGVTAYSPWGLRATGFGPFLALLRAGMARGGGLRIDHVCGLHRLWVVPRGLPPDQGGYLRFPREDMLRLLALESWRHRCIVIGEDLGTVPAGLRGRLAARGVLGMDVLPFMRDGDDGFLPPAQWRPGAVATTTTHDLPPLAAWREGRDIELRAAIDRWPDTERARQRKARALDVARLDRAIAGDDAAAPPARRDACLAHVARGPSPLLLVPLEDALGSRLQPNLPGTVDTHPNWRQRLPADAAGALAPALRTLAAARPREARA